MGKQYEQSVISQKPVKERIAECEKSRDVRVRERDLPRFLPPPAPSYPLPQAKGNWCLRLRGGGRGGGINRHLGWRERRKMKNWGGGDWRCALQIARWEKSTNNLWKKMFPLFFCVFIYIWWNESVWVKLHSSLLVISTLECSVQDRGGGWGEGEGRIWERDGRAIFRRADCRSGWGKEEYVPIERISWLTHFFALLFLTRESVGGRHKIFFVWENKSLLSSFWSNWPCKTGATVTPEFFRFFSFFPSIFCRPRFLCLSAGKKTLCFEMSPIVN